jgi:hypothetical protein
MQPIDSSQRVSQIIACNLVGEDYLFLCEKHNQRLIFYGGQEFESWETEPYFKFLNYLKTNNLELPAE